MLASKYYNFSFRPFRKKNNLAIQRKARKPRRRRGAEKQEKLVKRKCNLHKKPPTIPKKVGLKLCSGCLKREYICVLSLRVHLGCDAELDLHILKLLENRGVYKKDLFTDGS